MSLNVADPAATLLSISLPSALPTASRGAVWALLRARCAAEDDESGAESALTLLTNVTVACSSSSSSSRAPLCCVVCGHVSPLLRAVVYAAMDPTVPSRCVAGGASLRVSESLAPEDSIASVRGRFMMAQGWLPSAAGGLRKGGALGDAPEAAVDPELLTWP